MSKKYNKVYFYLYSIISEHCMLIEEVLELAFTKKASDIHISANLPPILRIDGKLFRTNLPVLSSDDVETIKEVYEEENAEV